MTSEREASLAQLVARLAAEGELVEAPAATDGSYGGATRDARALRAGRDLFLAWRGRRRDGHEEIERALAAGAVAAIAERPPEALAEGRPLILVRDSRRAWSLLWSELFGNPARTLAIAAVTGTNGKTTSSWLARAALIGAGLPAAWIGTPGRLGPDVEAPLESSDRGLTTPDAEHLHRFLASVCDRGAEAVVMEASSHALVQGRLAGLDLTAAALTNIEPNEHLDYHGTFEAYCAAKARLFELVRPGGVCLLPLAWRSMAPPAGGAARRRWLVCAGDLGRGDLAEGADMAWWAADVAARLGRTSFLVHRRTAGRRLPPLAVDLPLSGGFNVDNALVALGLSAALGADPDAAARALSRVTQVPGRFETIDEGQPFGVVVDYAHNPAALDRLLRHARSYIAPAGRMGLVVGCGGDRDRSKRPLMASLALRQADQVVFTSDNPRSEDPEAIVADMLTGVTAGDRSRYRVELDRARAIEAGLRWARPGDLLVVAGKGHESVQDFGDRVEPFDDREVARRLLRRLGYGGERGAD